MFAYVSERYISYKRTAVGVCVRTCMCISSFLLRCQGCRGINDPSGTAAQRFA